MWNFWSFCLPRLWKSSALVEMLENYDCLRSENAWCCEQHSSFDEKTLSDGEVLKPFLKTVSVLLVSESSFHSQEIFSTAFTCACASGL